MSFDISYIFNAVDRFSATASKISKSINALQTQVNRFNEKLELTGKQLEKTGKSISLYLGAPIVAFGVAAFREFRQLNYSMIATQGILRNVGASIGLTFDQLNKSADELAESTFFSKGQILGEMTNQLMKFRDVHGQIFMRAEKDIAQYAESSGNSLRAVTNIIGKALNDPSRGLTRLSRMGVILTTQQEAAIKHLVAIGKKEEVQRFLLKKIEAATKDVYAHMDQDPFFAFQKSIEKLKITVGEFENKFLAPFVQKIDEVISAFNHASPETQGFIIKILGMIAVVGPIIAILGGLILSIGAVAKSILAIIAIVKILTKEFELINIVLGMNPYARIALAIIALVGAFIYLYKHSERFRNAMDAIGSVAMKAINIALIPLRAFITLLEKIPKIGAFIKSVFGDDPLVIVAASPTEASKTQSKTDINMVVQDRAGVVKSIQSKTTGPTNLNVGRSMATAG